MGKIKAFFYEVGTWFKNHAPSKRRIIQLYAALLYNANIKGFITGRIFKGESKKACVPGLNCYSCPGAVASCPLGALQNAINSSGKTVPYYMLGIIALFGVIFARTICGFLCPIGMLQELLHKIKTPKIKKNKFTYVLTYLKWAILIVFVIAIPLGFGLSGYANPGFCKYFCPAGTFGGGFMLLFHPDNANMFDMLGPLFSWKTALLFAFIVMSIFMYRFFCRFFCPLGLIYGWFNKFSLLGVVVNKNKCTDCGLCVNACKMDIRKVGDHECIQCGECIKVCPENAITWKGSKVFLHKDQLDPVQSNVKIDLISNLPRIDENKAEQPKVEEVKPNIDKKSRTIILNKNAENIKISAELKDFNEQIEKYEALLNDNEAILSQKDIERLSRKIEKLSIKIEKLNVKFEENREVVNNLKSKFNVETETTKTKGKGPLYDKKKTKIFFISLFSALTLITATALIYYNVDVKPQDEPTTSEPSTGPSTETSTPTTQPTSNPIKVGEIPASFSVELYNNEGTYNYVWDQPNGKVKIFNFWATWCGPCVHELPYFNEIYNNYSEDVEIVAIGDYFETTKSVQDYIDTHFSDYTISFARDNTDNSVCTALGGKDSIPHTAILDKNNVCQFVKTGSMTYDEIENIIKKLI